MIVRVSGEARRDLRDIEAYANQQNLAWAARLMRGLKDRFLSLSDMPARYPFVPRYEDQQVRRCVHENYLIFYRIDMGHDRVTVLHVLHGAMDYESVL